jgi:hypothetical protein
MPSARARYRITAAAPRFDCHPQIAALVNGAISDNT